MRNAKGGKLGIFAQAVVLSFALGLCAAAAAARQGMNPKQPSSQQNPPAGQAQPAGGGQAAAPQQPPMTKEEEDAYKAFFELKREQTSQIIAQGQDFLSKFAASRYRSSVYSRLANAYLDTNQPTKMVETGEKALAENPDNLDVLAQICTVIPRLVDPNSLDADQKWTQAERYARHAIDVATNMTKPADTTDEDFLKFKNEKLGVAHYGLGLVNYMRKNVAAAAEEFEQAAKLDPTPEPLLFYLLGTEDMKLKKYPDAVAAFDRCATIQWNPQWQARCKQGEQDAKQAAATPAKP